MKIGILLTGHARWSEGLFSAYNLIIGDTQGLKYLNFSIEGSPPDQFQIQLQEATRDLAQDVQEVWILTDIVGGYPFQSAAHMALTERNIRVFGGVSMALLLGFGMEKDDIPEDPTLFIQSMLNEARSSLSVFEKNAISKPIQNKNDEGL
ncbi:MAG: PTS sugar transporter subunit IIA [Spirochaetia bacterium]